MLMLTVQVQELWSELLQRLQARQRTVHESPAASSRGNLATDDDFLAIGYLDGCFDNRALFAGADQVSGSPATEQQSEGADDDRFSGASLTGENVEPWFQFELELLDDGEMSNAEKLDHRPAPPGGPSHNDTMTRVGDRR